MGHVRYNRHGYLTGMNELFPLVAQGDAFVAEVRESQLVVLQVSAQAGMAVPQGPESTAP